MTTTVIWTEEARLFGQETASGSGRAAAIVGMELRYADGQRPDRVADGRADGAWLWVFTRLRDTDDGEGPEPARGLRQTWDATSGRFLAEEEITLDAAAQSAPAVTPHQVAKIVGERYPAPRIVRLRLAEDEGRRIWDVLMYDAETDGTTTARIDATTGERIDGAAGPASPGRG